MQRKFKIGDIVMNIEKGQSGYGAYGTVTELWVNDKAGVRFTDQFGHPRSWFESRLDFRARNIKQYGIVKFMQIITK